MIPLGAIRRQQNCITDIYTDIFNLYSKARMHRCWLSMTSTRIRQAGGITWQELDTMLPDTEALILECNTFLAELWNHMEALHAMFARHQITGLNIYTVLSANMACMCKAIDWKWTMEQAIKAYMELQAHCTSHLQFPNLVPGVHTIDLTDSDTEETETESEPETWAQRHPLSEAAAHRVIMARLDGLEEV